MSDLSKNAAKKFRSLKRRPNMPEWYPVLQVSVAVIFVLFIGFKLVSDVSPDKGSSATGNTNPAAIDQGGGGAIIGPDGPVTVPTDATTTPPSGSGDPVSTSGTEPGVTEPDLPAVTTTAPITDPTAAVTTIPDDSVVLPGPSGTTVAVPIAALDRVKAVAKASVSDTAVLTNERVAFSSPTRYTIVTDIDPDGDGPREVSAIPVTVTFGDGVWTPSL